MTGFQGEHGRSTGPDALGADDIGADGIGAAARSGDPAGDEDLLAVSPFDGDLAGELAVEPPRSRLPGPTLLLGAALLVVVGFIGGAQAQRLWGAGSEAAAATGLPGGAQGPAGMTGMTGTRSGTGQRGTAAGGGFAGAGGTAGGGATIGTVQKTAGSVIYLKTVSGETVKITTTGSTRILLSATGKVGDLKAGATVVVQGPASGGGEMTATSVSQSSGLPGGMPGGPGGGPPS